ncbi:MAG: cell division protein FtsA [Deltaproteobacteria bacterium]|nr:cell division protein FtsA [Deltaproteobacteria bacterium]MCL5792463.1 cell division protein FtsA [Deltaproteobacteria bacterium]
MQKKNNIIVGLDIGTTKICAIVGEINEGNIDIIGIGKVSPSKGLSKGNIINIESTVKAIKQAVEEAELMADFEITNVYTGIAGDHIKSFNSNGVIAIKDREVKIADIKRVIDAAKAMPIPADKEVIHVIPHEFIIDDQGGIKDPLGMSGIRLEVKVHIVTANVSSAMNIVKSCNKSGLTVSDVVLQSIASGEAVLSPEEKELGVALVDIGGGTTDIAIFYDGSIRYTSVIALGGEHLTKDVSVGLRTPVYEAEKIKIKYGTALKANVDKSEIVEVKGIANRKPRTISRQTLAEIIELRTEEILTLVDKEINKSGFKELISSGIVLTGGSALLDGIVDIAEQIFNLPVRVGFPAWVGGLSDVVKDPSLATAVGLVIYGSKNDANTYYGGRDDDLMKRIRSFFTNIAIKLFIKKGG